MGTGAKIRKLRQSVNWTLEDLSTRSGVDIGTIGAIELRDSSRSKYFPQIAKAFGLTVEDLTREEMIPLLPSSNTQTATPQAKLKPLIDLSNHPDLVAIPRVKFKLSAGISGFSVEQENGEGKPIFFRKDWVELNNYNPNDLFGVRVTGSSMETSLWDGDLVVVNTADIRPRDGECFAINFEGELVVKRLRKDAGVWWATSDNADQRRYPPKQCTEDVILIGRTVYKQSERI